MTRAEYDAAIQALDMELYGSWLPVEGEKLADKRFELNEQYIASLETEVAVLKSDNVQLIEQINAIGATRRADV